MRLKCCRCGLSKPIQEFAWRRRNEGKRDTYCRPCRAEYKQEHYAANRQRYIENATKRTQRLARENTDLMLAYFSEHHCADCGESDPLVLEFDHLRDKSFAIAAAIRSRKWEKIEEEIKKCEVVCANCHRRRTSIRGGWMRATAADR